MTIKSIYLDNLTTFNKLEAVENPIVIWFTGISGSGKSTLANLMNSYFTERGKLSYILDGDLLRLSLNKDLNFTKKDRVENIRRVGELSKVLFDIGIISIVSTISPFSKSRDDVRKKFPKDAFFEIYLEADYEACKDRDTKGLYKMADLGLIKDFTGLTSKYEIPKNPELVIQTSKESVEASFERIKNIFEKRY